MRSFLFDAFKNSADDCKLEIVAETRTVTATVFTGGDEAPGIMSGWDTGGRKLKNIDVKNFECK